MEIPPDRQQNRIAFDFIKSKAFGAKQRKLLDVGSADNLLKPFLPKNVKYYSLDIDDKEDKHDFVLDLDKKKIPVKNGFFDIVLALDVLEHTMYPRRIIKELKRVSKEDALFVISLPNEYNFVQRIYYLLGIKKHTEIPWEVVEKHQHIQKPRVKDIMNLLSSEFKILKIEHHWESRTSGKKSIFIPIDQMINFLSKIYPNLFARDVVAMCINKYD